MDPRFLHTARPSTGDRTPPARPRRRMPVGPVPASGAWRQGDPVGRRHFAELGPLHLEAGGRLPEVRLAYETWGTLNARGDNAILIEHALTGDSHVAGPEGNGHPTAGWWADLVGPGLAIDTNRHFVVAANVLGGCQGSTGPSSPAPDGSPWGSRFPHLTVRDQVAAEIELTDRLGIERWAHVLGASMGGHRVLEWAVTAPERVRSIAVIASGAQTTADQIAWAHAQLAAIELDPNFRGGDYYGAPPGQGPHAGLALARRIAHTTYRSAEELETRFGRLPQHAEDPMLGGRFAVQSYLDHHGTKLALRFDANSSLTLTRTMLTHDIGRDRGRVEAALSEITADALVIAVETDRLFLPEESERIAAGIPGCGPVRYLRSPYGHDGFLIEHEQVTRHLGGFLRQLARSQ